MGRGFESIVVPFWYQDFITVFSRWRIWLWLEWAAITLLAFLPILVTTVKWSTSISMSTNSLHFRITSFIKQGGLFIITYLSTDISVSSSTSLYIFVCFSIGYRRWTCLATSWPLYQLPVLNQDVTLAPSQSSWPPTTLSKTPPFLSYPGGWL